MDKPRSTAFMLKLIGDVGTAGATALLFVGERVGLFRAMAGAGPLTSEELAVRSGIAQRLC